MKECFICFENILHGVKFGCNHEICIYCFMKLESNLCPYCRFPIHKVKIIHYSNHIPLFLKKICKTDDIFSYILLQIYHSNPKMFNFNDLSKDIYKWTISPKIKRLYIREIIVMYKFIHPEKKQLLIFLLNALFLSYFHRNEVYFIKYHPNYSYHYYQIILYPIFVILFIITFLYTLFFLLEYKSLKKFNFKEREKIKIENLMD